ncbi:hypothetical protein D3C80_1666340 [compost metagenome]
MAEEAASLSTETDSTSSGFNALISPTALSINTSGPPPLIEVIPRILKVAAAPGVEGLVTVSPGTAP